LLTALWTSDKRGLARFDAVQPRYNLLYRELERELFAGARQHGVGIVAYNPLAGGVLTGKYAPGGGMPKDGRFTLGISGETYRARYFQDAQLEIVKNLADDVRSRGKSITHVSLRWVLDRPEITSAILGATSVTQFADSLGGVDVVLDEHDKAACDSAWWAVPRRPPQEER
jgi:aryl-alcohol dehydrogenase-like predicted oxidoreductase